MTIEKVKSDLIWFFIVMLITIIMIPLSEILYFKFAPTHSFISVKKYSVTAGCLGGPATNDMEVKSKNSYNIKQTSELLRKNGEMRVDQDVEARDILVQVSNNTSTAHIIREQLPTITVAGTYKVRLLRELLLPYNNKKTITTESNEFTVHNCVQ